MRAGDTHQLRVQRLHVESSHGRAQRPATWRRAAPLGQTLLIVVGLAWSRLHEKERQ